MYFDNWYFLDFEVFENLEALVSTDDSTVLVNNEGVDYAEFSYAFRERLILLFADYSRIVFPLSQLRDGNEFDSDS